MTSPGPGKGDRSDPALHLRIANDVKSLFDALATIDQFLELMDDPDTYPVLLHCKAGLHRTGVMVAAYRMEYEGRTPQQALEELRDNGFGLWNSTSANDYITQYILSYQPGLRAAAGE